MSAYRQAQGVVAAAVALAFLVAAPVQAIDWAGVEGRNVTLFYPGQSSWEWVLTPSDHDGGKDIREGKTCWDCHEAEEEDMGAKMVTGEKIEPDPIEGKRAAIDVNVKAAHDGARLYVRLEWADAETSVGRKLDPENEAKATVMIGDGKLVAFQRGGCWATCHDDVKGMPSADGAELTKYIAQSRTKITRSGGGENYKSDSELEKLLQDGVFLEYWHAHLNKGAAPVPGDGYILEKRHKNDNPAVTAEGGYENGRWVVVLSRKLDEGGPGHKRIASGTVYTVGFAIHASYADGRRHHVSFQRTLALDKGKADIIAERR